MNPVGWGFFRSTWSRSAVQIMLLWIPLCFGLGVALTKPEEANGSLILAVIATALYAFASNTLLSNILSFGNELQIYQFFHVSKVWPLGLRVVLPAFLFFVGIGPALSSFMLVQNDTVSNGWLYGFNLSAVALFLMGKFFIASALEGRSRAYTVLAYILSPGLLLRRSRVPIWLFVTIAVALSYLFSYLSSYNNWNMLQIEPLFNNLVAGISNLKSVPVVGPLLLFLYLPFYVLQYLHHEPTASLVGQLAFAMACIIVVAVAISIYRGMIRVNHAERFREFYTFVKAAQASAALAETEEQDRAPSPVHPETAPHREVAATPPPLPRHAASIIDYTLPMDYSSGEEFLRRMELWTKSARPYWLETYRGVGLAALLVIIISLFLIWPIGAAQAYTMGFYFFMILWAILPAYAVPDESLAYWITPQNFWRSLWLKIKIFHLPMIPGDIGLMILAQLTLNTNWNTIVASVLSLFLFRLYATMFGLLYRTQIVLPTILCLLLWVPVLAVTILPWAIPYEPETDEFWAPYAFIGVVMVPHILGWSIFLLATWWRFGGVFHVEKPR